MWTDPNWDRRLADARARGYSNAEDMALASSFKTCPWGRVTGGIVPEDSALQEKGEQFLAYLSKDDFKEAGRLLRASNPNGYAVPTETICPVCGREFSSPLSMVQHKERKHKE